MFQWDDWRFFLLTNRCPVHLKPFDQNDTLFFFFFSSFYWIAWTRRALCCHWLNCLVLQCWFTIHSALVCLQSLGTTLLLFFTQQRVTLSIQDRGRAVHPPDTSSRSASLSRRRRWHFAHLATFQVLLTVNGYTHCPSRTPVILFWANGPSNETPGAFCSLV